ncbi:MAG: DUF1648 domain-containing protein [Chloroflexi bacterium]|nr:MAG: DUF1648 domain-containing protein [Chloroflexota bacterium]
MSRLRTISLGLIGLTILISAWFYPQLPAQVPNHWDINGTVDGWQTPLESALFVSIICVVFMTILWIAGRLDPRPSIVAAIDWVVVIMLLFFVVLQVTIMLIGTGNHIPMERIIMLGMAGLFAGIGRAMRDVEPNGFVGIRTFWTMTNPQVWRETHLLAYRTMVISALITIVVACLPIPPAWLFGAGVSSILIGVFWPMIFAYRRYHQLTDGTSPSSRS